LKNSDVFIFIYWCECDLLNEQFSEVIIREEFYCIFALLVAQEIKIGQKLWDGFYFYCWFLKVGLPNKTRFIDV